ncbi:alpha/beta hydrolase [Luteithermobacter gelatinilyticus]|uniref:alpha/beta hydrolase n=1 Tax=Luteithermobacter gelatinilyticus TaxID=2582913 RepID=UPI001106E497|nr:alpha/beta hydrolase [Luteithermobacter gelatinilyticus]
MTQTAQPDFLVLPDGRQIAYHKTEGTGPTVVFLGGFMSDMEGSKALALEDFCRQRGQAYVRFDYSGHGKSSGRFEEGTIGRWKEDALAVVKQVTQGPLILVGSSMGGWIGLLVALEITERVLGFVGIAAAPDFTRELMWDLYDEGIRATLQRDGVYYEPSEYSEEPYPITMNLIQEGDHHLLFGRGGIELNCPVRLLHGLEDRDVPPHWSQRICDNLVSDDVTITYVKKGDHRLSTEDDLRRLCQAVADLSERAGMSRG